MSRWTGFGRDLTACGTIVGILACGALLAALGVVLVVVMALLLSDALEWLLR